MSRHIFSSCNRSNTSRIEVVVRDVQLTTQNSLSETIRLREEVKDALEKRERSQHILASALLLYLICKINQENARQRVTIRALEQSTATAVELESASIPTSLDLAVVRTARELLPLIRSHNTPSDRSRQGLCIRVSQRPPYCHPGCRCICHKKHFYISPPILNQLLGSLFIGYSGAPTGHACDELTCRRREGSWTYVTYHFPMWLITSRMLYIMMHDKSFNGPEYTLKIPRTVRTDSAVFVDAARGNVDGLKYLFEKGLAFTSDVAWTNQYTPLHVRPVICSSICELADTS